jgi:HK97 family phage portal protein
MGLRAAWQALWQPETKASRAGPLVAFMSAGQPAATPRRYDRLAEEGFQRNAVVFRCVNLISESAAAVPWQLFRGQGRHRQLVPSHGLLALLTRPNPVQGGASFFQAVYAFRLLSGNSYVEASGPEGGAPRELWTLRPDRMKVVPGEQGLPAAFEFKAKGKTVTWPVDPMTGRSAVLHSKTFHPLNDWYGMSPLEAAAFEVDQHNAAGEWNFALLKNQARPSGALVYTPRDAGAPDVLSEEQFARVRQQIDDLSGPQSAGRPLILEGGLDWRQMSLTPSEYEDAVLPLIDSTRDDLNRWLAPAFGDELALDFDLDAIPALAPRRERKWAMVKGADFLSVNEKRAELGFAPVEEGDKVPATGGQEPEETKPQTGDRIGSSRESPS